MPTGINSPAGTTATGQYAVGTSSSNVKLPDVAEAVQKLETPEANVGEKAKESTRPADSYSQEEVRQAIDQVAEYLQQQDYNLKFQIDEVLGRQIINVIDPNDEKVIRQWPLEEVLHTARTLHELQEDNGDPKGVLLKIDV